MVVVAAPLLHDLSGTPLFFTSRQTSPGALVLFAFVVGLVPPLVAVALEALAGLWSPDAAWRLHVLLAGLFGTVGAAQVVAGLPSPVAILLALGFGAVFGAVYGVARPLRVVATWAAPLALVPIALFLLDGAAESNVRGDHATPVVMVVFDEFTGTSLLDRDNRLDASNYPNFARLARDGTYYRNFTAAADETTRVMAALMTGDLWHEHAKPTASAYPHNVFTLLGGSYRMRVSEEASDFCPPAICSRPPRTGWSLLRGAGLVFLHRVGPHVLDEQLTPRAQLVDGSYDPERAAAQVTDETRIHKAPVVLHELGAGGRPARFARWLRSIDGRVGRTLYFKHVLLPHVPWQYLPDGRLYRREDDWIPGMSDPPAFRDRWFLIQDYQRHLIQLAYADRLLGKLVARLKKDGIYDKALIVVTADNGESFLHKGHDRHIADHVTFTDIASTPLLIKRPHQKQGGYDDRHVRSFDVVPTIAGALGLSVPWRLLGRSIFDPSTEIPNRVYVRREQFKEGQTFSISLAGYERDRRRALRRKMDVFGGGLWRVGPGAQRLIAGSAHAVETVRGLHARLVPKLRRLLRHVDPASGFLPANVTGVLTGRSARPGIPLALGLHRRIAAVGWSAKLAGDRRIWLSFMVEPSFLRKGNNPVALFAIAPDGTLRRIGIR